MTRIWEAIQSGDLRLLTELLNNEQETYILAAADKNLHTARLLIDMVQAQKQGYNVIGLKVRS